MASTQHQENVLEKTEQKTAEPPMYCVFLNNDDYTPFEFVSRIMRDVFRKSEAQAELITLQIHLEGRGLCGIYPKEVAEFKRDKVMDLAQEEGHPLLCTMERDGPAPKNSARP